MLSESKRLHRWKREYGSERSFSHLSNIAKGGAHAFLLATSAFSLNFAFTYYLPLLIARESVWSSAAFAVEYS